VSVSTRAGWTAGVGAEVALAGNWTGKIEYLHTQFHLDATSVVTGLGAGGAGSTATFSNRARIDIDTIRVGLN
jgi:opacity protein-like surface antigen